MAHPGFEQARGALAAFAELEKSPEHVHTYRISAVSLWNAAAAGLSAGEIADTLVTISRYEVPQAVLADVRDLCARYGRLRLLEGDGGLLRLLGDSPALSGSPGRAAVADGAAGSCRRCVRRSRIARRASAAQHRPRRYDR